MRNIRSLLLRAKSRKSIGGRSAAQHQEEPSSKPISAADLQRQLLRDTTVTKKIKSRARFHFCSIPPFLLLSITCRIKNSAS